MFADGSYLSRIYPSEPDRRHQEGSVTVRVVDYRLDGVNGAEPIYRVVTTILDPKCAPALDLTASTTNGGRSRPPSTN